MALSLAHEVLAPEQTKKPSFKIFDFSSSVNVVHLQISVKKYLVKIYFFTKICRYIGSIYLYIGKKVSIF